MWSPTGRSRYIEILLYSGPKVASTGNGIADIGADGLAEVLVTAGTSNDYCLGHSRGKDERMGSGEAAVPHYRYRRLAPEWESKLTLIIAPCVALAVA